MQEALASIVCTAQRGFIVLARPWKVKPHSTGQAALHWPGETAFHSTTGIKAIGQQATIGMLLHALLDCAQPQEKRVSEVLF